MSNYILCLCNSIYIIIISIILISTYHSIIKRYEPRKYENRSEPITETGPSLLQTRIVY